MIYIIEGPDGSGKSTLAQQISNQTGIEIIHRTKPETDLEKQNMMRDYRSAILTNKNAIFDRCWYSEMVYGKVMRDVSYIDVYEMYELEKELAKRGAFIIYCTAKEPLLWQNCQRRGEDYITCRDDFKAIHAEYEKLMSIPHYIPLLRHTIG